MHGGSASAVAWLVCGLVVASCGPAGRQMGSQSAMRARQDLWNLTCFAPEHVPVEMVIEVDVHGYVSGHATTSTSTTDEEGCVTRFLASVHIDGAAVRNPRQITTRFVVRGSEGSEPSAE